jgi:DNA-binding response OmpR family regulator
MAPTSPAFEYCRRIKEAAGGRVLPVILYALRWDADVVRRAYEAGADDCVQVRPTDDMLSWRVRSLLRLARACGPGAPGGE